jgi:acyl-CoA thioester hydrolase
MERQRELLFRPIESLDLRITYADCDPAQVIYFAAWFPWMERVQSEWMFRHGFRQDQLADRFGFRVVARAAECEYLQPCYLFDAITIQVAIARIGRTSLTWAYRMTREDGTVVATARTTIVVMAADGGPIPVPDVLLNALDADLATAG